MRGRLSSGDVLLLYTDGMVEEPRRDIELGIDEMLGVAEQLFRNSLDGLAERLAAKVGSPRRRPRAAARLAVATAHRTRPRVRLQAQGRAGWGRLSHPVAP